MLPNGKDFQNFKDFMTQLDTCTEPISESWISAQLLAIKDVMKASGQEPSDEMVREWTAFALWRLPDDGESLWGTHFGPFASGSTTDGQGWENPPRQYITLEAIRYWAQRSTQVKHPTLRLRFCELVWDFGQFTPEIKEEFKRKRIDYARRAISAASDCVAAYLHEHPISLVDIARRNFRLAKSIQDKALEKKMASELLHLHHLLKPEEGIAFRTFAFELLADKEDDVVTVDEKATILSDLEEEFKKLLESTDGFGDPHGAESIAQLLNEFYRKNGMQAEANNALVLAGQNFERVAKSAGGLLAPGFYNKARLLFEQAQDSDAAAAAFKEMTDAGPESMKAMKTIGGTFEISEAELESLVKEFTHGDARNALRLVAIKFLKKKKGVGDRMKEIAESTPFQAFISRNMVDKDGIVRAVIGGIEDDPDGHLMFHYLQENGLNAFYLRLVFQKIREHYPISDDEIVKHLLASPAFDIDNKEILSRIIKAYSEGDYLLVQHLAPAQIESSVRRVLRLAGVNINRVVRSEKYPGQIFEVRLLENLLRDSTFEEIFSGEDVPWYLRFLLTDCRGLNLRNEVYHGLFSEGQFNQNNAALLIHALLLLALVTKAEEK
jgi:hypothetical protein